MAPTDRRVQVPPNCDLTLGMTCVDKSEPGRAVWRMTADERFANPTGVVQGGSSRVRRLHHGCASLTWPRAQVWSPTPN